MYCIISIIYWIFLNAVNYADKRIKKLSIDNTCESFHGTRKYSLFESPRSVRRVRALHVDLVSIDQEIINANKQQKYKENIDEQCKNYQL